MALTTQQEAKVQEVLDAFENAQQITDLPIAGAGEVEQGHVEIATPSGESKRFNFFQAVHAKEIACRRWNESQSTPIGEAWGNIDFLRSLPGILGLGCYLIEDDETLAKRKLDPTDHYRFADGSPALLDGSMGQYMWCWDTHYYCTRREGDYLYEGVSLTPVSGWECYRVPAGGTSALGFGVLDRTTNTLCSIINNAARYRGGNNNAEWDGMAKTLLGRPTTAIPMTNFSIYARNRGAKWEAGWYVSRAVQEYLFRIIMGTRHSQTAVNPAKDANGLYQGGLGEGATQMPGWGDFSPGYYPVIPCSAGVELADGVGEATYNVMNPYDAGEIIYAAKIPVFFGLKNLWGNLWSGVRGLIVDTPQSGTTRTYVAPSMYDYDPTDDDTVAGMLLASEQPRETGWITKQSMHRLCNMPTAVGGTNYTHYADYFWTSPDTYYGLRCRMAGGDFDHWTPAGAGATNAYDAVALSRAAVSVPLCFFAEDPVMS